MRRASGGLALLFKGGIMGIAAIISTVLKLVMLLFSAKLEKDAEVKKRKEEAFNAVTKGLAEKNKGAVLRGFDSLN